MHQLGYRAPLPVAWGPELSGRWPSRSRNRSRLQARGIAGSTLNEVGANPPSMPTLATGPLAGAPSGGAVWGDAAFSPCGHYRWWLERVWAPQRQRLLFVGLNPSRADRQHDDPTLRRLQGFARAWGYGALEVLNLFARISPSPAAMRRVTDPVGAHTDDWIRRRLASHPGAALWLGWGNQGGWGDRDLAVLALLQGWWAGEGSRRPCLCLGVTASGRPRHPLYLAADLAPQPWRWPARSALGHPEGCPGLEPCRASPGALPSIFISVEARRKP
jgi:hypothetical protein